MAGPSPSETGVSETGTAIGPLQPIGTDRHADRVEAVSWPVAEWVATRIARREPASESYHYSSLQPDFEELTAEAEALVAEATGLTSLAGPARARVTDRSGWVSANVASFRRLLRPLTEKLEPRLMLGPLAPVSRVLSGVQLGTVLGWMSTRVLGQYDLLLIEDDRPDEQDIVYYVGPNVINLEKRYAFPPRQFRLWLALHEVTHRAQFTGIPWMRDHFLSLVESGISSIDPDPARFLESLTRAVGELRAGRNPLEDAGLLGLFASGEQLEAIRQVQALMSLLEGHGDITMGRAGDHRIPSAQRFGKVLRERRNRARGPARILQQLVGLEAKIRQYEQGERFIEAVEETGGPQVLDIAWRGPEWLPRLDEIRDPSAWLDRVGANEHRGT